MDKFYTVKELSKMLKLAEETIREKLRHGNLKGLKLGRCWRVTEKNLINYIKRKGVEK